MIYRVHLLDCRATVAGAASAREAVEALLREQGILNPVLKTTVYPHVFIWGNIEIHAEAAPVADAR